MPQKSLLEWAGYSFDVVQSTTVEDGVRVAQHVREDGTLDSDHLILLPVPVSAEVLVSDLPGDGTLYRRGRADDYYLFLLADLGAGTVATLTTGVRVHPDVVLTSVRRVRSSPEGAARLSLRWEPIRKASGVEVAVPLPHTSTVGAARQSVGRKAPEAPAAAAVEKGSSILYDLVTGG